MHAVLIGWLCLTVALGPAVTPSGGATKATTATPLAREVLADADKAWRAGDFATVRALLEPLAANPDAALEPAERETMLVLLADAWLGDKSIEATERRDQATKYLTRLMNASPDWRMPTVTYGPELYDLYGELRIERAGRAGEECEASLVVCKSDHASSRDEVAREKQSYAALRTRFEAQEVEVRETVARTRVLAAIPFGFGHFYNGDLALGGSFLAAEALLGAAGIGLLIQRTVVDGCRRTRGFQNGSLDCDPRGVKDQAALERRRDAIVQRRKGEEVVAWMLLGVVALDIVIAQIRFKADKTLSISRKPRSELDADRKKASTGTRRNAPGAPGTRKPSPRKPRASLRTAPMVSPRGVGLGVHVRF